MATDSVTAWIAQVKAGEAVAAQRLWERYLLRLASVAQAHLAGSPQQVADADDVVVVAFEKFLRFARENRFPTLEDRFDLWQVLVMVTEHAAIDQRRRLTAAKRGGYKTRNMGSLRAATDESASQWQPEAPEPSPEFAVAAVEQFRYLMEILADDELRRIAQAKVQGSSNDEIAKQESLSVRSIDRKLKLIRQIWTRQLDS